MPCMDTEPSTKKADAKAGDTGLKAWFAKHSGEMASKIVVALIGFVFGIGFQAYQGRLREFTYTLTGSANIFKKPELNGRKVTVSVDDFPIDNFATVHIEIFNTAGEDYENVPVAIRFVSADGSPLKLIQENLSMSLENVEPQSNTPEATGPLARRYLLKVVNRADEPFFKADYTFDSKNVPKVGIEILKKGVVASLGRTTPRSSFDFFTWLNLVLLAVIVVLFAKGRFWKTKERTLEEELKDKVLRMIELQERFKSGKLDEKSPG